MTPPAAAAPPRTLGFVDVLGLGVNTVVGSGIFLLPGLAAARVGPASLVATLVAGAVALVIALCFAEAAARFRTSGGAYVYARAAFGELAGFLVGWVSTCAGIAAWGGLAAAFAVALSALVPAVADGAGRAAAILAFVAVLGVVNYRGARWGARVSNAFTAAKLLVLAAFVATGAAAVSAAGFAPFAPLGWAPLPGAVLLMLYAFVGFENTVVPAGEMREPERSVPRALIAILAAVTLLYLAVEGVVFGTLETVAGERNAVATAATAFLGPAGGAAIAVGVVLSIVGVNAASALVLPRRLYAMAEAGDLPAVLARVHPRWGTPAVSVVLVHGLVAAVAVGGSFEELAVLTVFGRLLQYVPTCLAVLVLRRRDGLPATGFRLPLGPVVPLVALAASAWLLTQVTGLQAVAGAAVIVAGLAVYRWRPAGRRGRGAMTH